MLQFRGYEGEHLLADGPARQQIRSRGLELPRTGAKKSKSKFSFFDEAMDFVEKGRDPLDLVHDHPAAFANAPELLREQGRVSQQALVKSLVEKVEPIGILQLLPCPGSFADTPRSEEEEALTREGGDPLVKQVVYGDVILP